MHARAPAEHGGHAALMEQVAKAAQTTVGPPRGAPGAAGVEHGALETPSGEWQVGAQLVSEHHRVE